MGTETTLHRGSDFSAQVGPDAALVVRPAFVIPTEVGIQLAFIREIPTFVGMTE